MDKQIPEIPMNELKIDAWNPITTGFVTRRDTHVRITHLSTGIQAESSDERSVHMAKAEAMKKFEKAWAEYWSKPGVSEAKTMSSAERTLKKLGYTDCGGGEFWKPPLGSVHALLEAELAEARKDVERKTVALKKIAKWHDEFPPSCRFYEDGTQMSFGAAFGSNGQRDYMRGVAQLAIDAAIKEQQ